MRLNRTEGFVFDGNVQDLTTQIKAINENFSRYDFKSSSLENGKFRIESKGSAGVMMIRWNIIKPISIYCKIIHNPESTLRIQVTTRIRPEIYFFVLLLPLAYFGMITSDQAIPWWVFLFPLIPIPWFQWIYRLQEGSLIDRFSKAFNLNKL